MFALSMAQILGGVWVISGSACMALAAFVLILLLLYGKR
jgi:hypothetical protein